MVQGIPNITIPTIGYAMAQNGRMSFPVDSSSLIYSHFEHVSGIPAPKGTQGVAISKLNLLDVLIGQLNQAKKGVNSSPALFQGLPEAQGTAGRFPLGQNSLQTGNLTTSGLDALIENYTNQIRQAKAASAVMPYIPSPSAQPGAVFSITV